MLPLTTFIKLAFNKVTLFIALIIAVLILIGLWWTERSARIEATKQTKEAVRIANHKTEETTFYKNKLSGMEVAVVKQMEISQSNVKSLIETQELKFIKQFDGLRKDYKNLLTAGQFHGHVDTGGIPMTPVDGMICDSVFLYKYKDEYNDIEAMVIQKPKIEIKVVIDDVITWERKNKFIFKKWRWGEKIYSRQIVSPNKLIKIDSASSFTIRKN